MIGVRAGPGLMTATPSGDVPSEGCVGDCGGEAGATNIEELLDGGSALCGGCPGPP